MAQSKKKPKVIVEEKPKELLIVEEKATEPVVAEQQQEVTKKKPKEKPFECPFEVRMWHNIIPVYCCLKCDKQFDERDAAIVHVLTHYPEAEQPGILEKLIQE